MHETDFAINAEVSHKISLNTNERLLQDTK